jgi:hypothetical protein
MDFHEFNKKITEHFDHCDVADVEGVKFLDQKRIANWGALTTIMGNRLKLYDTMYDVMWSFSVRDPVTNTQQYLILHSSYTTRGEIKELHKLCSDFGLNIFIWGKYIQNSSKPAYNFKYSGGVIFSLSKENISDFTWKDDVLLKTLSGPSMLASDVWSLLRQAKKNEEERQKRIENKNKNAKLHTPGNARVRKRNNG